MDVLSIMFANFTFSCNQYKTIAFMFLGGCFNRDLKPEHIMFDSCGRMRIVDLFSAAVIGDDELVNREGTLSYMAPEMVSKPAAHDAFHDVSSANDSQ